MIKAGKKTRLPTDLFTNLTLFVCVDMLMILFIRMMIWKQMLVMYYLKKNEGK